MQEAETIKAVLDRKQLNPGNSMRIKGINKLLDGL